MADLDYIINFASNTLGLDNANSAIGKVGVALAALGVGFATFKVAGFLSDAVKGASDFEQQLATVQAVSGATVEQMDRIKEASVELGKSTRYNATQAAEGFEILARAGLNTEQALETIPSVLALAQGNALGLSEAAGFVTKAVQGMGLEFSESARVADVLAKASASANTDVSGLGSALSYAAPTANSLGLTLEETAAYIGKFADAGVDASRAGTALNGILSQFGNSASSFKRELANIGITTNDFNEAIRELAASGDQGQKAINALGLEAGPAFKALLAQGMPALDELTEKLNNAGGAAAEQAEIMNNTWQGAFAGLDSVWQSVKDTLGEPILEPLSQAFKDVGAVIGELIDSGKIEQLGTSIGEVFTEATVYIVDFIKNIDMAAVIDRVSSSLENLHGISVAANGGFQALSILFNGIKNGVLAIGVALSMLLTVGVEVHKFFIDAGRTIANFFGLSSAAIDGYSESLGGALKASEDFRSYADEEMARTAESINNSFSSIAGATEETTESFKEVGNQVEDTFSSMVDDAFLADQETSGALENIRANTSKMIDGLSSPEQFSELLKAIVDTGNEAAVGSELMNRLISGAGSLAGEHKAVIDEAKTSMHELGMTAEGVAEKTRAAIEGTFSALNIDVQQNLNGVNTKTQQTFDLIANGAKSVAESTYSATEKAKLLSALFAEGLNAAKTKEEFEALNEVTKHYGLSSVITAEQQKILQAGMKGGADAVNEHSQALETNTDSISKNMGATTSHTSTVRENTAARKEQSTATWNAKFATDEATKSESASLAFMQKAEEGIKSKIAALNQLSGSTATADESYKKLMMSMGFVDGYKWASMADYARDMERVQAAVDKQAESYSEKNNKHKRDKGSNYQSSGDNEYSRQDSVNEDRVAQDKRLYEASTEAYQKQWAAIKEASKSLSDADKALLDRDVVPKSMQSMYDKLDRLSDEIDKEGAKVGKTMQDTAKDKKGGYLFDYMGTPNQVKSTLSSASTSKEVVVKTINVNLQSSSGTVNATIPESQEAMFNAFVKQLQESKALAGQ